MQYLARYGKHLANNKVECCLCPRHCKIKPGQRGFCFVRGNIDGNLILTTYGRSSGFCVDPIEKKPLYHFLPGTPIFSFGTAGCNLSCRFCQNSDISKTEDFDRLNSQALPDEIAAAAKNTNCLSVAYTYNEPLIFLEYAIDTAKACKKLNIKNVAVSAGYAEPEAAKDFFGEMDAANIDLKAFNESFYKKLCGVELKVVLDNLIYIKKETNCWLEITTLLIPGENDSNDEIEKMTLWLVDNLGNDTPLHFSAFHPAHNMTQKPVTPSKTLLKAREIAIANGLRYVYTGNIINTETGSTFCHNCKSLLIERKGYDISNVNIDGHGQCLKCGTQCSGVFSEEFGNFGAKRVLFHF